MTNGLPNPGAVISSVSRLTRAQWQKIPFPPGIPQEDLADAVETQLGQVSSCIPLRDDAVTRKISLGVAIARVLAHYEVVANFGEIASILDIPRQGTAIYLLWEITRTCDRNLKREKRECD